MSAEALPWSLLLPWLAQATEAGFRDDAKSQMRRAGRTYAALGEAMGLGAAEARKVVRGDLRPRLCQVIGAARFFGSFSSETTASPASVGR